MMKNKGIKKIIILVLLALLTFGALQTQTMTVEAKSKTVKASEKDIKTMAAVCYLEAGTHYKNCLAVANVVLNRVKSKGYPNTINGVVYQKSQFSVAKHVKKHINKPKKTCLKAVKNALAGENNIKNRKSFRSASYARGKKYKNSVKIGDNVFF